jgi:hypothetical protein
MSTTRRVLSTILPTSRTNISTGLAICSGLAWVTGAACETVSLYFEDANNSCYRLDTENFWKKEFHLTDFVSAIQNGTCGAVVSANCSSVDYKTQLERWFGGADGTEVIARFFAENKHKINEVFAHCIQKIGNELIRAEINPETFPAFIAACAAVLILCCCIAGCCIAMKSMRDKPMQAVATSSSALYRTLPVPVTSASSTTASVVAPGGESDIEETHSVRLGRSHSD